MREKINYAGPWITEKEVSYVEDAVRNGFYANYRLHTKKLEEKVCELLGLDYALAVSSCTASIHLSVAAAGIGAGDEVITTDSSCVASALPIVIAGATAVFVDVDTRSWTISPTAIRRAITPQTRAILPVHWNGNPCDMTEILAIAREHNLVVLEDGAPALGAEFDGKKVGTMGSAGCFSFQGAKVAIGGQGGILATNDKALFEKAQILASLGRTDSAMQYWSDYVGWNYGMGNLPAALALAQVERLDELIEKKRAMFSWYDEGLGELDQLTLVRELPNTRSTYCYPALILNETARCDRGVLLTELRKHNIDSRPAQPRISKMPMFQSRFDNPQSARIETHGVILPSAFNLTRDDIAFVCERIRTLV